MLGRALGLEGSAGSSASASASSSSGGAVGGSDAALLWARYLALLEAHGDIGELVAGQAAHAQWRARQGGKDLLPTALLAAESSRKRALEGGDGGEDRAKRAAV